MLVDLIVATCYLILAAFVITQMFIPTITGRHWFPLFRGKRKTLLEQLEEARDERAEKQLKKELDEIKGENNADNVTTANTSKEDNNIPTA